MQIIEAIESRHSVRSFSEKMPEKDILIQLEEEIKKINEKNALHFQVVPGEEKAFSGFMARNGKFSGVKNYIAVAGKNGSDLKEKCGYFGEHLVLLLQTLGLNSCWVSMTYSKIPGAFSLEKGEKLVALIPFGYGTTQGVPHKSKSFETVCGGLLQGKNFFSEIPDWFERGVKAALLAPTAMNQQKFKFCLDGTKVTLKKGHGFETKIDFGIVKYHFEAAAGKENFSWN